MLNALSKSPGGNRLGGLFGGGGGAKADGVRSSSDAKQNGGDPDQMRDYKKRVDKMKHRFEKEQRRRRKKKEKEAVAVNETDEKFDYIALT
jgi:hypothetical protein